MRVETLRAETLGCLTEAGEGGILIVPLAALYPHALLGGRSPTRLPARAARVGDGIPTYPTRRLPLPRAERRVGFDVDSSGSVMHEDDRKWLSDASAMSIGNDKHEQWLAAMCELDSFAVEEYEVIVHGSYSSVVHANEVFVRYSAFANDRRINRDGSVRAKTYATTEVDTQAVPSGLAAVARYALPNPAPAMHAFTLKPPTGIPIRCGTVAPQFGQAGGGVEVRFDQPTPPRTVVGRNIKSER